MATISLENMEFFAYHGHFPEEQIIGTRFLVSFTFEADTSEAEINDDLQLTINYQSVYQLIKKEMEAHSKLIEHVALRILTTVCEAFPAITWARVKVAKMNPPLGGRTGSVSITLSTDNL
ncbi:MAG TPA: dihydroneopterin aldolase [Bacteroidales bacterium]|nr:dihydroneopterin aldolase [Bacteroidales bacterium]HSA44891.1 dihydroneopterin aldolase [Bacteroidales bacterium]